MNYVLFSYIEHVILIYFLIYTIIRWYYDSKFKVMFKDIICDEYASFMMLNKHIIFLSVVVVINSLILYEVYFYSWCLLCVFLCFRYGCLENFHFHILSSLKGVRREQSTLLNSIRIHFFSFLYIKPTLKQTFLASVLFN